VLVVLDFACPDTFRPFPPLAEQSQRRGRRFVYGANEATDAVFDSVPNLPRAPGKELEREEVEAVQVEGQPKQMGWK